MNIGGLGIYSLYCYAIVFLIFWLLEFDSTCIRNTVRMDGTQSELLLFLLIIFLGFVGSVIYLVYARSSAKNLHQIMIHTIQNDTKINRIGAGSSLLGGAYTNWSWIISLESDHRHIWPAAESADG